MSHLIARDSIKWILPLVLVAPVLIVASALTLLAHTAGKRSADDLANQNMQQIHKRIEEHLTRLFDMPPAINELNKRMLASGELSLSKVDRNRVPVFETLNIFQAVSSVCIGSETGEAMWVIRYPGETTYEYAIKRSPKAMMEEYPLADSGEIGGERLSHYEFVTTGRPWYKAAIAADGPTWGEVYVWVRGGKGETLGIPYVEPYRDSDGNIIGVINCELTLADISAFLARLKVGKTGKAFIIDSDGNLIATSEGLECMTVDLGRLRAVEASDPWIAAASRELLTRFGSPRTITAQQRAGIEVNGQPMRMVLSPYHNRRNLNWLIVTLVPDADFLADVERNRARNVVLGVIAVALMLVVSIVTAMKLIRAEVRIKQQKDMLETAVESLTYPFYVIDASNYSIVLKNSAAKNLAPSGSATCHALTHKRDTPCDGQDHPCPLEMVKKTGKPVVVEHTHYDAEGNRTFVEVNGYPIFDDAGNVVQMIEYSLDITDRKEMRAQLEEAREKAEVANQAKSKFLASMSHELRTPMNAILGYSEMLIEESEDLGQEEFIPDLKRIHGAGKHLLALINDILDLSKIEAGKMELYLETFDLGPMLDDIEATVDTLVKKKSNMLQVERGENLGSMHADMTKVRQLLFNLISNAAKFTENGTITLSAHREAKEEGDWVVLSVADTGIGIAEENLSKLFEEFTQADASTTRNFGGTGLGLTITQRFCEMMGGGISVQSKPGEGTTFTIRLPAVVVEQGQKQEEAAAPAAVQRAEMRPHRTVLVIDDDPEACDLLQRSLVKEGFDAVTASSGEEGLRLAKEVHPIAITLDVIMPHMDGWAVLKALKDDPDTIDIPVIIVSMVEDKAMGYTLGATEYLTKPIDRGKLLAILSRYRNEAATPSVLVVEDDAATREMVRRMLAKEGWVVTEAENGKIALDLVAANPPALILLDLMMPVMDGFGFIVELRKVEEWRDIPVIVVTSKDITEKDRQRLNGGVVSILQKGAFRREDLLEHVRALVAKYAGANPPEHEGEADAIRDEQ